MCCYRCLSCIMYQLRASPTWLHRQVLVCVCVCVQSFLHLFGSQVLESLEAQEAEAGGADSVRDTAAPAWLMLCKCVSFLL